MCIKNSRKQLSKLAPRKIIKAIRKTAKKLSKVVKIK